MDFEIIGSIRDAESMAVGRGIRDLPRLRKQYGQGHWKKFKGFATVCLKDGRWHGSYRRNPLV